jgi:hypothetical protein
MKKLALFLIIILAPPLVAQDRELKARVADDATSNCTGEKLLRLAVDGLVPLGCLPISIVMLPFTIPNPEVLATSKPQMPLPNFVAGTVRSLSCSCEGTGCTVNFNFDARAKSAPNTPGTDLHTSEMVADEDSVTVTSFAGDTTLAANEVLNLSISAVANAPTLLRCYVNVERN